MGWASITTAFWGSGNAGAVMSGTDGAVLGSSTDVLAMAADDGEADPAVVDGEDTRGFGDTVSDAYAGVLRWATDGEYDPAIQLFPPDPEPTTTAEAKVLMSRERVDPRKRRVLPGAIYDYPAPDVRSIHSLVADDPEFKDIHTIDGVCDFQRPLSHDRVIRVIKYFTGVDLIDQGSTEDFPKNLHVDLTDEEILKILAFFGLEPVNDAGKGYLIKHGRRGWVDPINNLLDGDEVVVYGNGQVSFYAKILWRVPLAINHFIRQTPIPIIRHLSTETFGLYWGQTEVCSRAMPMDLQIMQWLRTGKRQFLWTDNAHRNMHEHALHYPQLRAALNGLLPYQRPDIHRDFENGGNIVTAAENTQAIVELKLRMMQRFQTYNIRKGRAKRGPSDDTRQSAPGRLMRRLGLEWAHEKQGGFFAGLDANTKDQVADLLFGPKAKKVKRPQTRPPSRKGFPKADEFDLHVDNALHHVMGMVRHGKHAVRPLDRRQSVTGGNYTTYDPVGWFDEWVRGAGYALAQEALRSGDKATSDRLRGWTDRASRFINSFGTLNNIPRWRFGINKLLVEGADIIKNWRGEETILVEYNPKDVEVPGWVGGISNAVVAGAAYIAGGLGLYSFAGDPLYDRIVAGWNEIVAKLPQASPQLGEWLADPAFQNTIHSPYAAQLAGAAVLVGLFQAGRRGKSAARAVLGFAKLLYRPMHPTDVQGVEGIRTYRVEADPYTFKEMDESYEINFRQAATAIKELRDFFRLEVGELEEVRRHYGLLLKRPFKVFRPETGGAQEEEQPSQGEDFWASVRRLRDRLARRTR